jgi:diguanylate cyclase (GGDEF)-like protein
MTHGSSSGVEANILIVEDEANTLNIMREYLSRANFRIRTASNGWDAIKRLKDDHIDLVISEMSISDMDGSNLREKCILHPNTRDVPFLFLLDEGQTDRHVRALRSGVDDCITKPFDPVILVARVQAVIERRHSYEEMVRVDPLTRLLNRPSLDKEVREELARLSRYKRHASLVYLEIEDFDKVHTEGGVSMGDLLLTCLAGVILTSVRNMDIVGRYFGETFLLYLPETNARGAEILTTRIQKKMAAIADAIAAYKLTFTSGIVTSPDDGTSLDMLLERVQQAKERANSEQQGSVAHWDPANLEKYLDEGQSTR